MTRSASLAWKFALIALVAAVVTALPGTDRAIDLVLTALTIAFLTAIALLGYRLYMQFRADLDTLPDGHRAVLFGSVGLAVLTFCATSRLLGIGGPGVIVWLALLGLSAWGAFWVWNRSQAYE